MRLTCSVSPVYQTAVRRMSSGSANRSHTQPEERRMPKLTKFEDYKDKYPNFRLEKTDDNILLCQMHTDGGELFFDWRAHDDLSDVFSDISGDRELSVVIFTGTGDTFIDKYGPIDTSREFPAHYDYGAEKLDMKGFYGR